MAHEAGQKPDLQQVVLEFERIADRRILSRRQLEGLNRWQLETEIEHETGSMVMRIEAYAVAEKLAADRYTGHREVSIDYPATTWQMFKSRHAESWWLRWLVERRPVRMAVVSRYATVEVEVGRYLLYPDATVRWPSLGAPVIHEQLSEVQ